MATSWSLILNVLLLAGVVVSIGRLLKAKREQQKPVFPSPSLVPTPKTNFDEIIAIRKMDQPVAEKPEITLSISPNTRPTIPNIHVEPEEKKPSYNEAPQTLMMFLLAKENRVLAGYELLQTILAAGLRFGEGQLFHRHQFPHGQGPVLCSLAAATSTGTFDLQNIGAFSARGLCLFMELSGNEMIDQERFSIMLETAKQLNEGLDTHLLDDERKPLSELSLARYYQRLQVNEICEEIA